MNRPAIEFTIERLRAIEADERLRQQFTLEYWAMDTSTHPLAVPEDPKCGFSGCYMGWAIHQQWYARWGLMLDFKQLSGHPDLPDTPVGNIVPIVASNSAMAYQQYVHSGIAIANDTVAAVADLLGLNDETFRQVIYEEAYEDSDSMGPGDVANRLAEILELGEEAFGKMHSERLEQWEQERADGH